MKSKSIIIVAVSVVVALLSSRLINKSQMDYKSFVKQYFEHFNAHDWEAMAAMYTEEAEFKDPELGVGTHIRTRADIVEQYSGLSHMIPDVQDSVVAVYPSGDHIIIEFISTGTGPDGSSFQLPICSIITIENGLITRDYVYYDNF